MPAASRTLLLAALLVFAGAWLGGALDLKDQRALLVAAALSAWLGLRRGSLRGLLAALLLAALALPHPAIPADFRPGQIDVFEGRIVDVDERREGWRVRLSGGETWVAPRCGAAWLDSWPADAGPGAIVRARGRRVRAGRVRVACASAIDVCTPPRGVHKLFGVGARMRGAFRERARERLDPERTREGAFLLALVAGDRTRIAANDLRSLRAAGLAHVAVVSGLHVGLVLAGVGLVLSPGRGRRHPVRALSGVAAALALLVVLPAAPPIRRAAMTALAARAGALSGRGCPPGAALALATLALVLVEPADVRALSLQLTLVASAALVLAADKRSSGAMRAFEFALAPVLATWPVVLLAIGRASPWTLIANALAAPLLPGLLGAGWGALALPGPLAGPLTGLAAALCSALCAIAREIAVWPASGRLVASVGTTWCLAMLAATAAWLVDVRARRRCAWLCLALLLALWPLRPLEARSGEGLHVIDVGQGQALLIVEAGTRVLVDAGDDRDPEGTRALLAWMRRHATLSLDGLVVTHLDRDHAGGAQDVVAALRPRFVALAEPASRDVRARALLAHCARFGSALRVLQTGGTLEEGALSLAALHPDAGSNDLDNESSLVLAGRVGGVRVWLPGDAGIPSETSLLRRGITRPVDGLVAGHHGAREATGRGLLSALRPRIVFISAGRENRFGHPHPDTLGRIERAGARDLATSRAGSIYLGLRRGRLTLLHHEDEGMRHEDQDEHEGHRDR